MNLSNIVQTNVLEELKKGNTEVLKGLPPVVAMQYGLALQDEAGQIKESTITDEALGKAMLNRMADTGIKEQIIKRMEEKKVTD
ncbi:hypothetical protein H7U05_30900 [Priestia megaterium]|uniref:hypothetical protein n=1 Tax=Priestia megaterium TaxID=1404 RepID=UPI001C8EE432|nr:hypothetical protein [Priestia megaterium]MBY0201608.1 hypothetical protein [Priestia megaterium]